MKTHRNTSFVVLFSSSMMAACASTGQLDSLARAENPSAAFRMPSMTEAATTPFQMMSSYPVQSSSTASFRAHEWKLEGPRFKDDWFTTAKPVALPTVERSVSKNNMGVAFLDRPRFKDEWKPSTEPVKINALPPAPPPVAIAKVSAPTKPTLDITPPSSSSNDSIFKKVVFESAPVQTTSSGLNLSSSTPTFKPGTSFAAFSNVSNDNKKSKSISSLPSMGSFSSPTSSSRSTSSGSVPNAASTIAGMRPEFRKCYENDGDTSRGGTVRVQVRIGSRGNVESVTAVGQSSLSSDVVACLSHRIRSARFEAPGGDGSNLTIPIAFARQ